MAKLTSLQRRTAEIYHSMKKPNQAKAYKLAGSTSRGSVLEVQACKCLSKPQVKAYLAKLRKKSEEHAVKTADDIIRELEKVGFSNIKDYIEIENGKITVKSLPDLTDEQLAAIAEITTTTTEEGETMKLKLYDKLRALKDLGLRFGIFPTKIEHTGELTLAQTVHKAMKDGKK